MPKIKVKAATAVMVCGKILIPQNGEIELDQAIAESLGLVEGKPEIEKNATPNKQK